MRYQETTAYFHIISKDTGFDPLLRHLKDRKILAARSLTIESIPVVEASNSKTPEERAQLFIEKLRRPKVTRPRRPKTLASAVGAFFGKKLSEEEVRAVIAAMESDGFITIAEEKVSYGAGA